MLLPYEIEHIYPDYSIYPQFTDTAYGFLTRGCPRGCDFCIVKDKEGQRSVKVANLSEFWNGQKNICLMDPNMFVCPDWRDLSRQLYESNAYIDFNQGVDIRIMTEEKAAAIKQLKIKHIHFAWDRIEDEEKVVPKLKEFADITGWNRGKVIVYVLCNFYTTIEQDLHRIYTIRDIGFQPYVMIYEKDSAAKVYKKLQRYVNNMIIFNTIKSFEEYR